MREGTKLIWLIAGGLLLSSLAVGGGTVIALAAWQRSQNAQKWLPFLDQTGAEFGLPAALLARVAFQESSFEQDVIDGTRSSSAGALGMMQLEPQYFTTVNRPIPFNDQDTQDQITEAAGQLAKLYGQLSPLAASTGQNPWALVLAGYDAGAQAVKDAGGVPPYTETQNYVAKVLADVPAATAAA